MLPRGDCARDWEDDSLVRRRERERAILEEGETLWRAKQRQQWITKLQEKQEARDLLMSYAPWGKPGCGAPNSYGDARKKKMYDGRPIDAPQPAALNIPALTLGRPGCGAPLRTRSGRLQVAWRADPVLRFHEPGRRCVENELRYRASPSQQIAYRKQLDQMVSERRRAQTEARKGSNQELRHMLLAPAPWGRPGPGGAAWRTQQSSDLQFLHSLGWSSEPTLHMPHDGPPSGSGGAAQGKAAAAEEHQEVSTAAGADIRGTAGVGELEEEDSAADPYRRSGRSRTRHQHQPTKQGGIAGLELVPLLTRRRAALHHSLSRHPLCSTDITRHDVPGISEPRVHEDKDLLQTLRRQVICKKKQDQEAQQHESETTQRHYETWRQFWGRPGHGAPRQPAPKLTLAQLLAEEPLRPHVLPPAFTLRK